MLVIKNENIELLKKVCLMTNKRTVIFVDYI